MKKISVLLAVAMIFGAVIASTATAAQLEVWSNGTSKLIIVASELEVGLSPKVEAKYTSLTGAASASSSQWYAIGAAHPGGNTMYGTASDVNNIYKKTYTTGTAITNDYISIPEVATAASDGVWTSSSWRF